MRFLLLLLLCASPLWGANDLFDTEGSSSASLSHLRLDPHIYAGPRGNEPSSQLVVQAIQRWGEENATRPWRIQLHAEGEVTGRRDTSFDIDRAWVALPASWITPDSTIILGRIHPWDISQSPDAGHSWGLLGTTQAQNRGVLLGYGFRPEFDEPDPYLLGWLGAHYWSDQTHRSPFAFGFSATPFFVPNLGSEVSLSRNESMSSGRFGRRPPGFVVVNGARLPIRYDIDRSHLVEEVLLQPQFAAQADWKLGSRVESWMTVMRSGNPEPTADGSGYLQVSASGVDAVAQVRPRFPPRWTGMLTTEVHLPELISHPAFFTSLEAGDDLQWGWETGLRNRYVSVSLLNQRYWEVVPGDLTISDASYGEWLAQADLRIPIRSLTLFSGVKTHLTQKDLWFRAGLRVPVARGASLDLGGDVFSGGDDSYFGEWRTNSRVYTVLNWEIGA